MTDIELYAIGRALVQAGWTWETWSGSFTTGDAKGWWFKSNAAVGDVRGVRRGDPKPYDMATITTRELYAV